MTLICLYIVLDITSSQLNDFDLPFLCLTSCNRFTRAETIQKLKLNPNNNFYHQGFFSLCYTTDACKPPLPMHPLPSVRQGADTSADYFLRQPS